MGHKIDQNGIRPLQDKLKAIQELKEPKNEKELKYFLGAIQYLSKYIEILSAQTDLLRKLLKKNNDWIWTPEHSAALTQLKNNHGDTVFNTLQLQSTEHNKYRRQYKRPRGNSLARTT